MTYLRPERAFAWHRAFEELEGRKVLVTGGSTGIGAAVARAFGACGAEVAVHCHESRDAASAVVDEIIQSGCRGMVVQADLSLDGAAGNLVAEVDAKFGGLDLLINNAGSILGRTPTLELRLEDYRKILDSI